jgi:phage shock protein PspC (stress-responsive transcriptional regulator)
MQRVIHASLNRNPYPIEEDAYARLETYLAESTAALADDPDREEILLDLEQAVADQCRRRQPPQASVITLQELLPALEEIGPVRAPLADQVDSKENKDAAARVPLQQISQGAWVSGVCLGLARHLRVEVTLVRVIAAALLFFTGGAALLLYGVLMLLMPFAPLDPQLAPARKLPAKLREWTEALRGKLASVAR